MVSLSFRTQKLCLEQAMGTTFSVGVIPCQNNAREARPYFPVANIKPSVFLPHKNGDIIYGPVSPCGERGCIKGQWGELRSQVLHIWRKQWGCSSAGQEQHPQPCLPIALYSGSSQQVALILYVAILG